MDIGIILRVISQANTCTVLQLVKAGTKPRRLSSTLHVVVYTKDPVLFQVYLCIQYQRFYKLFYAPSLERVQYIL